MTLCNENAPILVNEEMGCNIWLMTVRAPEIASTARPGQFVHVKVPGMEAHILRRPFGVYAADAEAGTVDMMYQVLGFGTEHMTELAIGDAVEMIGPIGRGWQPPEGCKRALIVAGGVGSAPLYPLVEELTAAGVATDAILGASTIDALVARERYGAVLGCEPACSTDDGTYGRAGFCTPLVEEALAAAAAEGAPYDYVACCGPEPLMKIVAGMADAAGVFCEVSMERRMACGVGACLSCVVDTVDGKRRACVDGPVFPCERGGVVMQRKPKETSVNLSVNLGGMAMKNPVTVASGTFGAGMEYHDFVDVAALGAVTTKGVSLNGWEGNASPRIAETASGMLNSIGLQNPGVAHLKDIELPWLAEIGATAMVNVSGHSFDEYVAVIGALEEAPVAAYEVNISCPNVDAGGMTMGCHVPSVEKVVSLCRAATKRPLIVKLTPNVTDITEIAKAAEAAGADGISLINTLLGMAVDARTRRPKLARVVGGYSGPAVKPVALRMVWQVSQAVSVPVLGMGGIATGEDAVEFMLAGATAVAVGTANFVNPTATVDVIDGIIDYCESQGVKDVNELIGALQC